MEIIIEDQAILNDVIVEDDASVDSPAADDEVGFPNRVGIDGKSPYLDPQTKTWWQWDIILSKFVDTGVVGEAKDFTQEIDSLSGRIEITEDELNALKEQPDDVQPYETHDEFPSIGRINTIYIDKSTNKSYRFDVDNLKYYQLNALEIETINGGE